MKKTTLVIWRTNFFPVLLQFVCEITFDQIESNHIFWLIKNLACIQSCFPSTNTKYRNILDTLQQTYCLSVRTFFFHIFTFIVFILLSKVYINDVSFGLYNSPRNIQMIEKIWIETFFTQKVILFHITSAIAFQSSAKWKYFNLFKFTVLYTSFHFIRVKKLSFRSVKKSIKRKSRKIGSCYFIFTKKIKTNIYIVCVFERTYSMFNMLRRNSKLFVALNEINTFFLPSFHLR